MFDRLVASLKEERELIRKEAEEKAYREKLESARRFKAQGYPVGRIAENLSLPEEVVAGLEV